MRVLEDGCSFCGFSLVYCNCVRYMDNLPCCSHCRGVSTHMTAPTDTHRTATPATEPGH